MLKLRIENTTAIINAPLAITHIVPRDKYTSEIIGFEDVKFIKKIEKYIPMNEIGKATKRLNITTDKYLLFIDPSPPRFLFSDPFQLSIS